MNKATGSARGLDSILEALRSDVAAGTDLLSTWIAYIHAQGSIETLFELEAWLRGLSVFFDLKHVPLCEAERKALTTRSFAPEVRVVRLALKECERCALLLCRLTSGGASESDVLLEAMLAGNKSSHSQLARMIEQSTPTGSLLILLESITDLKVMIDAIEGTQHSDFRFFLSLGRTLQRDIRHCRYIQMLLEQRFQLQFDRIDNAVLSGVLKSIKEERLRRDVALILLYLFRLLHYLGLLSSALRGDRPLLRFLVLFSLLHERTDSLCDFIRSRILKGRYGSTRLRSALELILHSLQLETQRVFEQDLVFLSAERDASIIHEKIESSHALLQDCYRSCVVTIVRALDESIDPKALFPSMLEGLRYTQKVTNDLWNLRGELELQLEQANGFDLGVALGRISRFRESSLQDLRYQDWGEFEQFSDSLIASGNEIEARAMLRRFITFLEGLIQEVSKRSVPSRGKAEMSKQEPSMR